MGLIKRTVSSGSSTDDATMIDADLRANKTGYARGAKITGILPENNGVDIQLPMNGSVTIPYGIHDGLGIVHQELDSNIVDTSSGDAVGGDITINKKAFVKGVLVTGTKEAVTLSPLNFTTSIQDATPSPVGTNNHIWVKNGSLASQITAIYIVEALNVTLPDNSLQLVVGNLALRNFNVLQNKQIAGGNNVQVSLSDSTDASCDFAVSDVTEGMTLNYKLHRPLVYSKIGGAVDMETAYIWDGTSWVLISQNGEFLGYNVPPNKTDIFNIVGDSYVSNFSSTTYKSATFKLSKDGSFALVASTAYVYSVLHRTGNDFVKCFDVPTTFLSGGQTFTTLSTKLSGNGQYVVSAGSRLNGSNYDYAIAYYKWNGTTYTLEVAYTVVGSAYNSMSVDLQVNNDGSLAVVCWVNGSGTIIGYPYLHANGTITKIGTTACISGNGNTLFTMIELSGGLYVLFYGTYFIKHYQLDIIGMKFTNTYTYQASSTPSITLGDDVICMTPDEYILYRSPSPVGSIKIYNPYGHTLTDASLPTELQGSNIYDISGMCVNLAGTKIAIAKQTSTPYYKVVVCDYTINVGAGTISLTNPVTVYGATNTSVACDNVQFAPRP